MNNTIDSIWFDLDGTLLDTAPDILGTYAEVFRKFGFDVRHEALRIGPPLRECILEVLPDCDEKTIAGMIAGFIDAYDSSGFPGTVFYPGIQKLLQDIHEAGIPAFVATNKRMRATELILKHFELEKYFAGVYATDVFPGEKLPKSEVLNRALALHGCSPAAAVMVGDTSGDIKAGQLAGMITAGVKWGYGSPEELSGARPDFLFDSADELWQNINNC